MKRNASERTSILVGCLLVMSLAAGPALALSLAEARNAGQVGERLDGYVGIVIANPSAELRALVADVNHRRSAEYQRIARQNGTAVHQVAALAANKLIARAGPGHYVQGPGGSWVRK